MNEAREPPEQGRRFYEIRQREDGHVDVYLTPILGHLIVVWGVEPRDDLEDDIRLRYGAWCASGEVIV